MTLELIMASVAFVLALVLVAIGVFLIREALRERLAQRVQPELGQLIDEWELAPRDAKSDPDLEEFDRVIEALRRKLEG